jgi:class 3 adenylate cyclase
MSTYLASLASFTPQRILRLANNDPASITVARVDRFPAAVLFADISGFTALTERLTAQGPSGAEDLTHVLNLYFGQMIDLIGEYGGDVVKFAGDALIALWPASDATGIVAHVERIAQCSLVMQARLHNQEVADGLRLSMKLAIGAGEVLWEHLGGVFDRWELLIAGQPLVQVGIANGHASPGDIVVSAEAWCLIAQAARHAIRAYANREAIDLLRQAITLVQTLPDNPSTAAAELRLQLELGPALVAATHYGAPEVQALYDRARGLCRLGGDPGQLFRALRGLWQYQIGQSQYDLARATGDEMQLLAEQAHDTALQIEAHRVLGNTAFWTGNFPAASVFMERAVALYDPVRHQALAVELGQDPDVANRGILSWALCFLGRPQAAGLQVRIALERAELLGHPFSRRWYTDGRLRAVGNPIRVCRRSKPQ